MIRYEIFLNPEDVDVILYTEFYERVDALFLQSNN